MCYLISSFQLLFSLPKFSNYFVQNPVKVADVTDRCIFQALQYLAGCNLRTKNPEKILLHRHAMYVYTKVAHEKFGLNGSLEHDPAEFMTKFIEYLVEIFANTCNSLKIDQDLFVTEIKADSAKCHE